MTRTALIVGAGIGGLSAGIALRQAGWTIRIFERAASPRELGFGLGLASNAMGALRELAWPTSDSRRQTCAAKYAAWPHTGQGATQAIVDAVALGKALRRDADVARALRSYERASGKTAALLAPGRRTARVMRTTNPVACYIREVVVRLIPITPMVKILVRINRRAGTDVS